MQCFGLQFAGGLTQHGCPRKPEFASETEEAILRSDLWGLCSICGEPLLAKDAAVFAAGCGDN
jgi:hypothetical protein